MEITDVLTTLERRPRRHYFYFLLRHYQILFGFTVSLILVVATFSHAFLWTVGWISLYWLFHLAYYPKYRRKIFFLTQSKPFPLAIRKYVKGVAASGHGSEWLQFGRCMLVISSVTIYLAYIYSSTGYSTQIGQTDTLWLLYLLATLIISQRGRTEFVVASVLISSVALVGLDIAFVNRVDQLVWSALITKILWLVLLAFILHILIKYIYDRYADVRLLHILEGDLLEAGSTDNESRLLQAVVDRVAADFGYQYVNVFSPSSSGALSCIAGASPAGRQLVECAFSLQPGVGIIGHVATTGLTHVAQNVQTCRHYQAHPSFPDTKAEFAVPIKSRGSILGVLDIQVDWPNAFLHQDMEVMETLSNRLGGILSHLRSRASLMRIDRIVASIADRFLSRNELKAVLDEIARAAKEELGADMVVLYERNPLSDEVNGPIGFGSFVRRDLFENTRLESDSLVWRLLKHPVDYYFHDNVQNIPDDDLFRPSGYHLRTGIATFDKRENIVSRAIFRLRADVDCVGLMFLNFRSSRKFEPYEKEVFHAFARLAALAIQKAQFQERQLQIEREEMGRRLHDQLTASADGAYRLVSAMVGSASLTEQELGNLQSAQNALMELLSDISYLNQSLQDSSTGSLRQEVDKIVERVAGAYTAKCDVKWVDFKHNLTPAIVSQIKLILNEAFLNAVKHSRAKNITLTIRAEDQNLCVEMQDDGTGFDMSHVNPRGIANMQLRATRLGGRCNIDSTIGKGTHIIITIPITFEASGIIGGN